MAKNKYRIALLVDYLLSDYSRLLYQSICDACYKHNFEVLVFPIGSLHDFHIPFNYQNVSITSLVTSNFFDGVIVSTGAQLNYITRSEISSFMKAFTPLPVVSIAADIPDFPSVVIRCKNAYRVLLDNLIDEQKCKKIAVLGIRSPSVELKARRDAIRTVLQEKNFPMENVEFFKIHYDYQHVQIDLDSYVAENDGKFDFDAIIAFNDEMAFAAADYVKDRGLSIPKDVVIAGYDNFEQAEFNLPPVTSIDQHIEQQGEIAINILESIFNDEEYKMITELDSSVIFRDSTQRFPYSEELKNKGCTQVSINYEKLLHSKNSITDWYMQRSQLWQVMKYHSETQFDMTVEQLSSRINSDLRSFGIQAAAIVMYESPVEMVVPFDYFNLPHRASVFSAYDESTGYDTELFPEKVRFDPNEKILPDGILNYFENGTIVSAIYHNTLQYGYIILRPEKNRDFMIYDFVVKLFSSMMSSVYSFARVSNERSQYRKRFTKLDITANTDELTGLYNRRGLFDLGQTALKFAKAMNQKGILIYCDMDGLKNINDTYGHEAGDRAIIAESIILKGNFRSSDVIARIGGDEFVVICPELTEEAFKTIEFSIQNDCKRWTEANESKFKLSISMGVIKFPSDKVGYEMTPLLSEADANLYIIKRSKKIEQD